jgi:hypothetical protein
LLLTLKLKEKKKQHFQLGNLKLVFVILSSSLKRQILACFLSWNNFRF